MYKYYVFYGTLTQIISRRNSMGYFINVLRNVFSCAKKVVSRVYGGARTVVSKIITVLKSAGGALVDKVVTVGKSIWSDHVLPGLTSIFEKCSPIITKVTTSIQEIIMTSITGICVVLDGTVESSRKVYSEVADFFRTTTIFKDLADMLAKVLNVSNIKSLIRI